MKATAVAHPIQGLVKYHGMRDHERRLPYHDSISVSTAPSRTITTAAFESDRDEDLVIIDGERQTDTPRLDRVVGAVRDRAPAVANGAAVHLESANTFPTNVGLGSSSSGFAAAAMALVAAAGLDLSLPEISTIARRGSASAARAVTGGFSHLHAGLSDADCRSERIETTLGEDLSIIVGLVPAYKETDDAHAEAEASHMFDARRLHVQEQIMACRDGLRDGAFEEVFALAERDSLSLAATTMTGPDGWVYWKPATLRIFETVRELRADGIPAYFSVDTGATVYVNTREQYADEVEQAIAETGVDTKRWEVGGPARIVDTEQALF